MATSHKHQDKRAEVVMVMVPFVAQGHLNQLLHLSRLISAYNIPVHFISTTTHTQQARRRLHGWNPNTSTSHLIHFHEFPTPDFPSPPPKPNPSFQFPTHLQPSFDASLHLRRPTANLILSLSHTAKRIAVVHDSLMSYVVQDVKSIPNAETYIFHGISVLYVFASLWEKLGRELPLECETLSPFPSLDGCLSQEFMEFKNLQLSCQTFHVGNIYDSSRVIEAKFLEFLEKDDLCGKTKHWAIGPFNPVEIKPDLKNRHKCLQWLDKQPTNSVIYVSFGTTTTFTNEQICELAIGLARSQQKFLWVLRNADKGDVHRTEDQRVVELPNGFEERVGDRGLVVRDWAPQLEILGHSSTGGFLSHCGWNSSMESMTMGVPLAAWPIHSDQPRNAFLVTEVLRVGLVMRDWARRDELVTWAMVENVVRRLMDSAEGEEIRERAAELCGAIRWSVVEGGVTYKELDSFVSYICR